MPGVIQGNQVLSESDIGGIVQELATQISRRCQERTPLAFIGIHNRGVTFAERVREIVGREREDLKFGTLDISLYRDDLDNLGSIPKLKGSDIDFNLEGCHVVLFDDVLFTGRTVRAALGALIDYGRPAKIELAVLIDRGNRELPVQADYVGHKLETTLDDYVSVRLKGADQDEGVYVGRKKTDSE